MLNMHHTFSAGLAERQASVRAHIHPDGQFKITSHQILTQHLLTLR